MKELSDTDLEALTDFVDDPKLNRIIGTVNDIADGGLGDTAACKKLILCHFPLRKKLFQP